MYCYTCMNESNGGGFCRHCGSPLGTQGALHHLPPGTVLNAKYLIGNFIGEGGFGITYIGKELNLDVRVAIKEYYPRGFVNRSNDHSNTVFSSVPNGGDFFQKGKKRFLEEARSIAKFPEEEGIVNVRDFFQENGTAYIVMDYLDGENLGEYIRKRGRMEVSECIRLMVPVMGSLQRFHEAGMIHRDISPDNIMFLKTGTLKLMDFGSARYFTNHEREMSVILKKGYSPEEQYRKNGSQGPWTDVYSLCATIYSCITGVKPENALDRLYQDTLKRPSELGIHIRADQENALMNGLAVSPGNRCRSVVQLMNLLGIAPVTDNRQPGADPYKKYGPNGGYGGGMGPGVGNVQEHPQTAANKTGFPGIALAVSIGMCAMLAIVSLILVIPNLGDAGTGNSQEDETKTERAKSSETASTGDTEEKASEDQSAKKKKKVSVPDVVGLRLKDAKDKLKTAGLKVDIVQAESDSVEKDYIISQSPVAEKKAKYKDTITVYVSTSDHTDAGTPEPSQPGSSEKILYCCAKEYITLREYASRSAGELARIKSHEAVQYISTAGEFFYVTYKGQNGYVLKDYLSEDPDFSLDYGSSSTPIPTSTPAPVIYYCRASESATLRSEASRSGAELARIGSREEVQYLGSAGEFYNVLYKGQNGYVLKGFFSEDPNAALNYGDGSAAASDPVVYYCCASEYATLRAGASRSEAGIAKVGCREAVQYISSAGEFYYVSYKGQNGYVLKNYFSTDPNASLNYGTN